MGKKIESIKELHTLGLPAPGCVFILENNYNLIDEKICEYFKKYQNSKGIYTIRTDTENNSMSCKRLLSATQEEIIRLTHQWKKEGFQIILQELIDERNEIKSGNIWIKENTIIIEGAIDKHINFTNGKSLDINLIVNRFDSSNFIIHKFFKEQKCFTISEIMRLIRFSRKIPYTNVVLEFSIFKGDLIYFWEIKKEEI